VTAPRTGPPARLDAGATKSAPSRGVALRRFFRHRPFRGRATRWPATTGRTGQQRLRFQPRTDL